ncbi:MAG: DNA modification methylase [Dehalococcoidia bacterium]|nr:DNA modification methylase [Dehalococcoidia bacterium]
MTDPRKLKLTMEPLSALLERKRADNPKLHDEDTIVASMGRAGYVTPVIINDHDDQLLAGHGRVEALAGLRRAGATPPPGITATPDGEWLVPTIRGVDLDADDAKAFLIADNRTTESGGWDDAKLAQMLVELSESAFGLTGVGFDGEDLDRIVSSLLANVDRDRRDPDDIPEVPDGDMEVRSGDVFRCGVHVVACADARRPDLCDLVGEGRRADCLLTDPPYGVLYKGKSGARLQIANDCEQGLDDLLLASFTNVDAVLAPGSPVYVFHPAGPLSLVFAASVQAAGWTFRQSLVWTKGVGVLGRSDYHYAHEPILYASKPAGPGKGRTRWYGGRDQTSVLEFPRPRRSTEHPTMKPVGLIEALLKNSTRRGDLVLDPFLGSGSTLIAAERLGRRCVGVELDPRYAQVAVRRWEAFTGQNAHLMERNNN